jgi:hypothetical protein
MDLPSMDYGWAAALVALTVLVGAILRRVWIKEDSRDSALKDAGAAYRRAVESRDARAIRVAAKRLRRARDAAGGQ